MNRRIQFWLRGAMGVLLLVGGAAAQGPIVEHLALEVALDPPGGFRARAIVQLAGVQRERVSLTLNSGLHVTSARDGEGGEVTFQHGWRNPFSRYRREGRTVIFKLPAAPATGRVTLDFEYEGAGEHGDEGDDWRGILFVGREQVRMSEQTIFYPQIPLAVDGPAIQRSPVSVVVEAPEAFEVFVPAILVAREPGAPGRVRWSFESQRPIVMSLLAGLYQRTELDRPDGSGGPHVTLLLRPEHAELAAELAREARAAMAFFGERFGELSETVLGIVEIDCRKGTSINWASQGVAAFDRGAFGNGVPVNSVAHEVAHLWWGQAVSASGRGERFLTESLAEYSAWRYLAASGREALEREQVERARASYLRAAQRGQDRSLAEVTFRTPGYSALAYAKGPLVLRRLQACSGTERVDRALAEYASSPEPSLDGWLGRLAGGELTPELRAWFEHDGHPRFELLGVRATTGGAVVGAVEVHDWVPGAESGSMVEFELVVDGARQREQLVLQGPRTSFEFASSAEPLLLRFDPDATWPGARVEDVVFDGARLIASEPAQGARDVPFGARHLRLEFDRELTPPDLEALERAQDEEGFHAPWLLDWELDGKVLTLTTTPWLPDTSYSIALGALLSDTRGAPALARSLDFATAPSTDETAPRVTGSSPQLGAEGVALDVGTLTVTFDEGMSASRGFKRTLLRQFEAQGLSFPPVHDLSWDAEYRSLICPVDELQAGTRYVLPIRGTLFRDVSGNPVEDFDLIFETAGE